MFGMNLMGHDVLILNISKYPVFAVVLASLYPYTEKMINPRSKLPRHYSALSGR